jgi:hypothetical protein
MAEDFNVQQKQFGSFRSALAADVYARTPVLAFPFSRVQGQEHKLRE